MLKRKLSVCLFILLFTLMGNARQVIPLYNKVPNSIQNDTIKEWSDTTETGRILMRQVKDPALTVFLPAKDKATGTAIIICPGGGYSYLVINKEGTEVAKAFANRGVTAFVLKYRLPDDRIMQDRSIGPLQDAQRALQLIRERAKEWHIDPAKVGIMGFSAGGHLASTASTHFHREVIDNPGQVSLRPDFSILIYPVISFSDSLAHKGSRKNLAGEDTPAALINLYSNEQQVTAETPPTFIFHCADDNVVPVMNSIRYYEALLKNNVPGEIHIYPVGGHGFGLRNKKVKSQWLEICFDWMRMNKWLK